MPGASVEVREDAPAEVLPSLDELAETVEREHRLAVEAGTNMVQHAIRCGDALLRARSATAPGEWLRWQEERGIAKSQSWVYMRLAYFKHLIQADGEVTSIVGAMRLLQASDANRSKGRRAYPKEVVEEARRLEASGMAHRAIADTLGVTHGTIWRWCDPNGVEAARKRDRQRAATRYQRLRRAEAAAKRQERDRLAKRVGGNLSEAYSLCRRLAQELDRADESIEAREVRSAAKTALSRVHSAEDAIVEALRAA